MLKFFVSMGVLFFVTFSLSSYSQEVKSDSPADAPELPDEVIIESSVGDVHFPHNIHIRFGCAACHHQIQAIELDTPHPDYLSSSWINCQTCHNTDSDTRNKYYKCSDCHHSEPIDIADETLSSKVVIHKSCWKCHKSGTGVKASEGCSDCHVKEQN